MGRVWKYHDGEMALNIDLPAVITILKGDSATGKTYFVNRVKAMLNEKSLWTDVKSNIKLDTIVVCNCRVDLMQVYKSKDKFIIFDRFDIYADKALLDFINTGKNIILMISRRGYKGIKVTFDDIFRLENDIKGGISYFSTKRLF